MADLLSRGICRLKCPALLENILLFGLLDPRGVIELNLGSPALSFYLLPKTRNVLSTCEYFFLLLLTIAAASCASWAGLDHQNWVQTDLYFGLKGPDGEVIGDSSFQQFVQQTVSPAFPAGYTLLEGKGQWRMEDGTLVEEPSRVLRILHPKSKESSETLDHIADEYCEQFEQEAVMRISRKVKVNFPDGD